MSKILKMKRKEILRLRLSDCILPMTVDEFFHIAKLLVAFWEYDYAAAKAGRVGFHPEFKSGFHGDTCFNAKVLLEQGNFLEIMAFQLIRPLLQLPRSSWPDYVAGIPTGATNLGKMVAKMLCAKDAILEKRNGRIYLITNIGAGRLLLLEDTLNHGTACKEAIKKIRRRCPNAQVVSILLTLLNRGGLEKTGALKIVPVVGKKMKQWRSSRCPLCKIGSKPIKPKSEENWELLVSSQG